MLKTVKRFLFSVFIFLSLPFVCFSQYNFFKGYVVTNVGDTLRGFVHGKENSSNPNTLRYKATLSSETQRFSLNECAAFGIEDKEYYERYTVKISLGRTSFPDLSTGIDTTSKVETVFLKILQKGKNANLYIYNDLLKTRFYIKENTAAIPVELMYYNFFHPESSSKIVSESKFQNQLHALFKRYQVEDKFYEDLPRTKYDESDLIKMVTLVNHQNSVPSKYPPARFFVSAGGILSKGSYTGNHIFASESATATSSVSPYFIVGVDIFANPAFRKSVFRIELSTFSSTNEFSFQDPLNSYYGLHKLKQHNIVLAAQMLRHIYNGKNQKVFIGGGFSGSFTIYSESVSSFQYSLSGFNAIAGPVPARFHFSIPLVLGVVIQDKVELSFGYSVRSKITNYIGYSIRQERYRLGVGYLFNKKRS